MSAREIGRELAAARLRRIDTVNDAIHIAWKTAYYTARARSKKRLPPLAGELVKDDAAEKATRAKRQTKEQTATMIRMLAAQYGGTIRRVEGGTGG
jgi:hypothetical protein